MSRPSRTGPPVGSYPRPRVDGRRERKIKRLLIAAACCGGAALGPALALAQSPGPTMLANDGPPENWQANGVAGQTALAVAAGQTVTFANHTSEFHNLDFTTPGSGCTGVPMSGGRPGWSQSCTFTTP